MKNLEDFLNDLKNDEILRKEFEETKDQKQAMDLLKRKGYNVSEDELTELYLDSVSGGKISSTKLSQIINVSGSGNVTSISGNQYAGCGSVTEEKKDKVQVNPLDVLQLMFGKGLG